MFDYNNVLFKIDLYYIPNLLFYKFNKVSLKLYLKNSYFIKLFVSTIMLILIIVLSMRITSEVIKFAV